VPEKPRFARGGASAARAARMRIRTALHRGGHSQQGGKRVGAHGPLVAETCSGALTNCGDGFRQMPTNAPSQHIRLMSWRNTNGKKATNCIGVPSTAVVRKGRPTVLISVPLSASMDEERSHSSACRWCSAWIHAVMSSGWSVISERCFSSSAPRERRQNHTCARARAGGSAWEGRSLACAEDVGAGGADDFALAAGCGARRGRRQRGHGRICARHAAHTRQRETGACAAARAPLDRTNEGPSSGCAAQVRGGLTSAAAAARGCTHNVVDDRHKRVARDVERSLHLRMTVQQAHA
jgi:hypothetical protein